MRPGVLAVALCALTVVACDNGSGTDAGPGGMDAGPADAGRADADTADASASGQCRASAVPGCTETCQFFYDCVVNTTLSDRIEQIFEPLGFDGADHMDCTRCVERCEAGENDEAALTCFTETAASSFCDDGMGDPTVAAGSVNVCCEGELDSSFCQGNCAALTSLAEFFPMCEPFWRAAVPSTCSGTCPDVVSAMALDVSAEGGWEVESMAIADDGSFAVVGLYEGGTIDFGAGALAAATGTASLYLAVFAPDGSARWSVPLGGGHLYDAGSAFAVFFQDLVVFDDAGNVAVLVPLEETTNLGDGDLVSAGETDILMASWTSDGTLRWSRAFGGPDDDFIGELVAAGGDLYFTSVVASDVDFGGGALPNAGGLDAAVARFDTDGNHVWSRGFGSPLADTIPGIAVHPSGEYTVVGGAGSGADLGDGSIISSGALDSFVARYAADGTLRWSDLRGGSTDDFGYQVAARGEDVVVSNYVGSVDFDGSYGTTAAAGVSWAIVSYTSEGTIEWARVAEDPAVAVSTSLHVDASGRVARGDDHRSTVDYGGGPHTSGGGADIAVTVHDADGTHRWTRLMGTLTNDPLPRIRRLASGELMMVGAFRGVLDYGSGVLTDDAQFLYAIRFAAE